LQAQVQYVEGGTSEELTVAVRLPNGEVLRLDGSGSGGGGAAGQTIDVEWKEL